MGPRILLLHPWIHDFSAFDLWLRPLSLYLLATVLRRAGFEVGLYDCLNRDHRAVLGKKGRHRRGKPYGCGHFYREAIAKPACVSFVPRHYRRYGTPIEAVEADLRRSGHPDAVIASCMMTYWYPGVREAIALCRRVWPGVPVYLGGLYADLLPGHARAHCGADEVFSRTDYGTVTRRVASGMDHAVGATFGEWAEDHIPPAYDLAWSHAALPVLTSRGCPYHCTYCASPGIYKRFDQFPPEAVATDIVDSARRFGTRDFAFYDDALLVNAPSHLAVILDRVLTSGLEVRFHTPNALHASLVTAEAARQMRRAGFRTIRLGLEFANSDRQANTGGKVDSDSYRRCVAHLREAGFTAHEVGTYVMFGYPGQSSAEVRAAARLAYECGSHVRLVMYAPIPGSPDWEKGFEELTIDAREDPLLTNDSLAPYRSKRYTAREYLELKREVAMLNEDLFGAEVSPSGE